MGWPKANLGHFEHYAKFHICIQFRKADMAQPTRPKVGRPSKGVRRTVSARLGLTDHAVIKAAAKAQKMDVSAFLIASAKLVIQKNLQLPADQKS